MHNVYVKQERKKIKNTCGQGCGKKKEINNTDIDVDIIYIDIDNMFTDIEDWIVKPGICREEQSWKRPHRNISHLLNMIRLHRISFANRNTEWQNDTCRNRIYTETDFTKSLMGGRLAISYKISWRVA